MPPEQCHQWEKIKNRCIRYKMPTDGALHEIDVIDMRKQEISNIRHLIHNMLERVGRQCTIVGWRMKFFPCQPSRSIQQLDDESEAMDYFKLCMKNIDDILDFTKKKLGISFPSFSYARQLNFSFRQPKNLPPLEAGVILQFLANRQREFMVLVSPDFLPNKYGITEILSTIHPHDPGNDRAKAADHFFAGGNAIEDFNSNVPPPEKEDENEDT